jgi:hypothetical protein
MTTWSWSVVVCSGSGSTCQALADADQLDQVTDYTLKNVKRGRADADGIMVLPSS